MEKQARGKEGERMEKQAQKEGGKGGKSNEGAQGRRGGWRTGLVDGKQAGRGGKEEAGWRQRRRNEERRDRMPAPRQGAMEPSGDAGARSGGTEWRCRCEQSANGRDGGRKSEEQMTDGAAPGVAECRVWRHRAPEKNGRVGRWRWERETGGGRKLPERRRRDGPGLGCAEARCGRERRSDVCGFRVERGKARWAGDGEGRGEREGEGRDGRAGEGRGGDGEESQREAEAAQEGMPMKSKPKRRGRRVPGGSGARHRGRKLPKKKGSMGRRRWEKRLQEWVHMRGQENEEKGRGDRARRSRRSARARRRATTSPVERGDVGTKKAPGKETEGGTEQRAKGKDRGHGSGERPSRRGRVGRGGMHERERAKGLSNRGEKWAKR